MIACVCKRGRTRSLGLSDGCAQDWKSGVKLHIEKRSTSRAVCASFLCGCARSRAGILLQRMFGAPNRERLSLGVPEDAPLPPTVRVGLRRVANFRGVGQVVAARGVQPARGNPIAPRLNTPLRFHRAHPRERMHPPSPYRTYLEERVERGSRANRAPVRKLGKRDGKRRCGVQDICA